MNAHSKGVTWAGPTWNMINLINKRLETNKFASKSIQIIYLNIII